MAKAKAKPGKMPAAKGKGDKGGMKGAKKGKC